MTAYQREFSRTFDIFKVKNLSFKKKIRRFPLKILLFLVGLLNFKELSYMEKKKLTFTRKEKETSVYR